MSGEQWLLLLLWGGCLLSLRFLFIHALSLVEVKLQAKITKSHSCYLAIGKVPGVWSASQSNMRYDHQDGQHLFCCQICATFPFPPISSTLICLTFIRRSCVYSSAWPDLFVFLNSLLVCVQCVLTHSVSLFWDKVLTRSCVKVGIFSLPLGLRVTSSCFTQICSLWDNSKTPVLEQIWEKKKSHYWHAYVLCAFQTKP